MEAYLKSLELGSKIHRFRVPEFRKYTRLAAGLLFYYTAKMQFERYAENKETELKKARLSMPVYEMTEEDYKNPPWSGKEYENWKYRLIKVTGREIHVKSMLIPEKVNQYEGFQYFLPLIHSEDDKLENQVGIIINKGWLPHEYKNIHDRMRVENSFTTQEHTGVLHRGENLSKKNFWKKGNVFDEQRWIWNNFYLNDMSKAVKLSNMDALKQGVIELLDLKETKLDENDPLYYAKDLSLTLPFPHPKTLSGILQPAEAKWNILQRQAFYTIVGALLLVY